MRYSEVPKHFDARRREFTPYGFTCEVWEPQRMPRPDRHNEIEVNFLTGGSLTYLMWGRRVTVSAGRVSAFWAAIPHQILEFEGSDPYYVITVPLPWMLSWALPERLAAPLLHGDLVEERTAERRAIDAALFAQWHADIGGRSESRREIAALEVRARLLRLAEGAAGRRKDTRRRRHGAQPAAGETTKVERMAAFVARHYADAIHIPDVAAHVGLNPDYAAGLFKKTFGMTLNSFIVEHRLSHAQRLLVTTDDKILKVAMDSGFNAMSRFNAAFKEACGCTPREYRRRHRG